MSPLISDVRACSICGERYSGDGNAAKPLIDGRCCDRCSLEYVIPVRLEELRAAKREATLGQNLRAVLATGSGLKWREPLRR